MKPLVLIALLAPGVALASGGGSPTPPKPSGTTKTCKGVKVWDDTKKRCVRPKQSSMNDSGLIEAARELAYAGRHLDAQGVLQALEDPRSDLALTYWGFTHRKLGNAELGNAYYQQAIAQNPDNHLARSYMGQGYVEAGLHAQALAQWKEIRARGGSGTWAEESLRKALETGQTFTY